MPQSTVFVIIATLVVIAGAFAILNKQPAGPALPVSQTEDTASSTASLGDVSITTSSASSSYTVTIIPTDARPVLASPSAPSLTRNVMFSTNISEDAKDALNKRIAELKSALSKNYGDFGAWMNLALQYKAAGDYNGAREIWEYIIRIYPRDMRAFHNLGDLYQNFLNDYVKAEEYYKLAISADPTQAMNYLALHNLYGYLYKKDTSAAVDILRSGLTRVGGNQAIDLYTTLGSYYEGGNDKASAIVYYAKARDAAQKAENTELVLRLDATIAELQK